MSWLEYTDDEVQKFHPVFSNSAAKAIETYGQTEALVLKHHLRTPGNKLVPDFVLCEKQSERWILAVEVKRTINSLYSTRNQIQAKGYAEAHLDLYWPNKPKYFLITNLEHSVLFSLRNNCPPNECILSDGKYDVGSFNLFSKDDFEHQLSLVLGAILGRVLRETTPSFDDVWSRVLDNFISTSALIRTIPLIDEPKTRNWNLVRNYFCHDVSIDAGRLFLLRCMLAEYIRGILERFGHQKAASLLALRDGEPRQLGNYLVSVFTRLRTIDFANVFEDSALEAYRGIDNDVYQTLSQYIQNIMTPPMVINELARSRLDRMEFLVGLLCASHKGEALDNRGKVATDPELAAFLASLLVTSNSQYILDPCCGDGALLEAAYDRLKGFNFSHNEIIAKLHGIEADPLLSKLSFLRLALKDPCSIVKDVEVDVKQGDMFANQADIQLADVVLINPPFKRYECQDGHRVPDDLKMHYSNVIEESGYESITKTGQQNFYTYYLEMLLRNVKINCRIGIILDNKWYHNQYAAPLKKLLLETCAIEAVIEYPFANLFAEWTIATSILICRKVAQPSSFPTKFIRCEHDLSRVDMKLVSEWFQRDFSNVHGWTCQTKEQSTLDYRDGWKNHFDNTLRFDFRSNLAKLTDLFRFKRRGSLAKEEGGMGVLAFPFSRQKFGYLRYADANATRRYQSERGRELNPEENAELRALAANISADYKGYAVENADTLHAYTLDDSQLMIQPTIEPPLLRNLEMFWSERKSRWTDNHRLAIRELEQDREVSAFIRRFRTITGLNEEIMPNEWLWVALKEPFAGELIIPRKLRAGHRVHINPYACQHSANRQVRISSNFISFAELVSIDPTHNLDRLTAVKLIGAFLVSSFGQLQFEMYGYNREGCLSLELHHLENIGVIDPRQIPRDYVERILRSFERMPYPIPMNTLSSNLSQRNELDEMFSEILCSVNRDWRKEDLLAETHETLDDYLLSRNP